tara:strand:+ start:3375 stop:4160 length:786 start_codon:yes stop_codon:yes gene_type:complete
MIKIVRRLKANNFEEAEFYIYPLDEFKGRNQKYKHWSKCSPGDWGVSDDNYVAECLQRNIYGTNVEMVFPYGRQFVTKTGKLEFEPHYYSKNYSNVSTKGYNELEANRDRAELAIDAYLAYKMAGKSPDMEKIGKLYRPDQKNPAMAVKRLLKTKETKKIMTEKLKEVLIDRDIDEGYVLDIIKDAVDVAKMKEDPANMIRAAKELSEFLEMKPKQKQLTESVEMDISHQISTNFEKERKKLKATKVSEIDKEDNRSTIKE